MGEMDVWRVFLFKDAQTNKITRIYNTLFLYQTYYVYI